MKVNPKFFSYDGFGDRYICIDDKGRVWINNYEDRKWKQVPVDLPDEPTEEV